ncbi:TlpA family protein disulfide reductase [Archangium violaceum]|uniref:TlpA family protein disulfide reductase n=1 Tax=Archangium violaceum TaxID=83451 RepID=UPI002B2D61D6|nr:TlpA family protein disulfide reductase [Archangium violaceum]
MHPISFLQFIDTWGLPLSMVSFFLGPLVYYYGQVKAGTRRSSLLFLTLGGMMSLGSAIGCGSLFDRKEPKLKRALMGPVGKQLDVSFTEVVSGNQTSLGAWSGKVVLLQFWASWNDDARLPMRDLEQVRAELDDADLAVVVLSDEPRDVLLAQPSVPQGLVRGTFKSKELPEPLRDLAVRRPVSVLIDRKGVVRDVFVGKRAATFLADELREYL